MVNPVPLHQTSPEAENAQLRGILTQRDQLIAHLRTELGDRENDNSLLRRRCRELQELAYRDRVTGLSSRIHLEEVLTDMEDKTETFCLAMMDLDYFKNINDQYGHHIGDEVLGRFGAILKTVSHRENDVCARWGGEEFVVILRNCDTAGAKVYGDRLERRIHEDLMIHQEKEGTLVRVTASVGIAQRARGETVESLMRRSDKAMYWVKQNGRNGVKIAENV